MGGRLLADRVKRYRTAGQTYDRIGASYSAYRRPDPRIARVVHGALGEARRIVDVGSGTGSYEPAGPLVVAVEPSWTMIRQRPAQAAPVVRAAAERLPFRAGAFDAALAVLTVHHWSDPVAGLREMTRVARRQVVLTWDPDVWRRFWLIEEYLPEFLEAETGAATLRTVAGNLYAGDVIVVPVPADCTDGFAGAYWRRPEMYLDPGARSAISGFSLLDASVVERAVRALARDLAGGAWQERHADLLTESEIDLGYRLVVATRPA